MPRNPKFNIVRPCLVFSDEEIRALNINDAYLNENLTSNESIIEFAARLRIIYNSRDCSSCASKMSLIKRKKKFLQHSWRCTGKDCKCELSLADCTYFFGTNLPLRKIIKILYYFSRSLNYDVISYELNIDRKTVAFWANSVINAAFLFFMENSEKIGGIDDNGDPKIVEIDESLFFKRKYNRGRITNGSWYVGGIERGTKKCFLVEVPNRNAETLAEVIKNNVCEGSIIITDEWRAYHASLSRDGMPQYEHLTVNHSYNFVSPDNPIIHTQSIEGLWSLLKRNLRARNGISSDEYFLNLIFYIWKRNLDKNKVFNEILILFNKFY